MLESVAESEIYNKKKYSEELVSKKDFSYSKEREKESLLLLLGICRDNVSLEENVVLFDIVKNLITSNASTVTKEVIEGDNNTNIKYNNIYEDSFVGDVYKLEKIYTDFLSDHYNKTIATIRYLEQESPKIITNISYISQDMEPVYYNHGEIAYQVVDRFPIIKAITYPYISYEYAYESFINENKLKLTKQK